MTLNEIVFAQGFNNISFGERKRAIRAERTAISLIIQNLVRIPGCSRRLIIIRVVYVQDVDTVFPDTTKRPSHHSTISLLFPLELGEPSRSPWCQEFADYIHVNNLQQTVALSTSSSSSTTIEYELGEILVEIRLRAHTRIRRPEICFGHLDTRVDL
jgi:hypothetical protein